MQFGKKWNLELNMYSAALRLYWQILPETKDMNEMCISMLSTYSSIYNGKRKTVHISTYKLFFKKHFKILKP